jgi:S1-C subfamily serine protease
MNIASRACVGSALCLALLSGVGAADDPPTAPPVVPPVVPAVPPAEPAAPPEPGAAKPSDTVAPAAAPQPPESPAPVRVPYVPGPTQAADLALARGVEQNLVDALTQVRRYTVSVLNLRRDRQGSLQIAGVGSGVMVNKQGKGASLWVITNVHVTAGSEAIDIVTSDGRRWRMTTEDEIARYDFALLRFADKPKNLKGVDIKAQASQGLGEGAWVLATGNPFFLALDGQPVCTLGCISGTDRILGGEYFYGNAIQHDAEVNPGNSGGPLWNAKGQLIGINGKIASRPGTPGAGPSNTGASFSIPIHQVSAFLDQLVKPADAQAGFLGIDAETVTNALGNPIGAKVTRFQRGSPASSDDPKEKSMVVGDVIESITLGGKAPTKVFTANDLTNALVLFAAGTKVKISYRRDGKLLTWSGVLGAGG